MIPATPWLEALDAHLAAAPRGDQEDVHQLRVATRRLTSWLKLARLRVLRSDLRWLRAAGGRVRDVDVVLGQDPPDSMARWLRAERDDRVTDLRAALHSPRVDALRLALGLLPPVEPDRARRVLPRLARRALFLGDELQRAPNDVEGFHALRRSVRNLRYALEWLDEKTGGFKEFQDVSGRAADLSSALLLLDACPDAEALTSHRHLLDEEFAARRLDAVATWPSLRETIERQA